MTVVSPIVSLISLVISIVSLLFLPSFGRGDQELSKTFYRLKIGPLLRKLQAFKDWSFLGGFPHHFCRFCRFPHRFHHFPHCFLSFLLSFDRGDQELSKTFYGLKIGPLLRKLQAFKDWSFLAEKPQRQISSLISSHEPGKILRHHGRWKPRHHGGEHFQSNFEPLTRLDKVETTGWKPRHHEGQHFQSNIEPLTRLDKVETMGWKPRHHGGQHFQSNFKPQTRQDTR